MGTFPIDMAEEECDNETSRDNRTGLGKEVVVLVKPGWSALRQVSFKSLNSVLSSIKGPPRAKVKRDTIISSVVNLVVSDTVCSPMAYR